MLVLDTDHISILGEASEASWELMSRLEQANQEVVTTVISVEENLQGWLSFIHSARTPEREIYGYQRLFRRVEFLADWVALLWDMESAGRFQALRRDGVRIGSNDLKIACVTLEHDATLLTRNRVDFAKVPGLKLDNWLDKQT